MAIILVVLMYLLYSWISGIWSRQERSEGYASIILKIELAILKSLFL